MRWRQATIGRSLQAASLGLTVATCAAQQSGESAGAPLAPIALNICNYCISTRDIYIPLKGGGEKPVSRMDFVQGGTLIPLLGMARWHRLIRSRTVELELSPDDRMDALVIAVRKSRPTETVAMPQIRSRAGERFSKWLRTDSVCIGSQFRIPPHYFVASDNQPMVALPYEVQVFGVSSLDVIRKVGISSTANDLPSGGPIVCEGELRPFDSFFRDYVGQLVNSELENFRGRSDAAAINAQVDKTTAALINSRFNELAATVADLVVQRTRTATEAPPVIPAAPTSPTGSN